VKTAWKALHFTMRILKNGNSNTKSLAYTSLVRLILEYGAACWDPYRMGQINVLDWVQNTAAKFARHTYDLLTYLPTNVSLPCCFHLEHRAFVKRLFNFSFLILDSR
jgi:hypothetical protein